MTPIPPAVAEVQHSTLTAFGPIEHKVRMGAQGPGSSLRPGMKWPLLCFLMAPGAHGVSDSKRYARPRARI